MACNAVKAAAACAVTLSTLAAAPVHRPGDPAALPQVERDYRYPHARITSVTRSPLPSLTVKYETGDDFARVRAFYTALARRRDPRAIDSCTKSGDFCAFFVSDGRFRVSPMISSRTGGATITTLFFVPAAEKRAAWR
jgi:hypothetical protein